MKRLLNICLLLTSLIGYLQWGKDQHAFLFQVEYDLIFGSKHSLQSFIHPFILIPLCGQLVLFYTIFQKTPNKALSLIGLICLSLIMLLILLIGIMTKNSSIAFSAIPFVITGILVLRYNRKQTTGLKK